MQESPHGKTFESENDTRLQVSLTCSRDSLSRHSHVGSMCAIMSRLRVIDASGEHEGAPTYHVCSAGVYPRGGVFEPKQTK